MAQESKRSNPTVYAYNAMREMLMDDVFLPGQKINQAAIAERLGLSRTPVVKALSKMETDGLVDNIENRGFFVHQMTVQNVLDIYSLRQGIDIAALNGLLPIITDEQIEYLHNLFAPYRGKTEWTRDDMRDYWRADREMHSAILELCGNKTLKRVSDNLLLMRTWFSVGLLRPPQQTLVEHDALIEAIRQRDLARARAISLEHLDKTLNMLMDTVNHLRRIGCDPDSVPVSQVSVWALERA